MCIWIANGTIWCRFRTCSAVTLPSVHTRSINLQTIFATALPVSPGSCSSKPSSLYRSTVEIGHDHIEYLADLTPQ
uniref:Putative secreted protein n=1 Tax=Anopheles marajoara TaxID=58244 RepID=A0A2M4CCW0_9DIPT